MNSLRVIFDEPRDGASNMSIDEAIFVKCLESKDLSPVLRFYRFNAPTLTVGYGMFRTKNPLQEFMQNAVKRPTGGGAVLHSNDLIYSFVLPLLLLSSFKKAKEAYQLIHSVLCDTLKSFGIEAELFCRNQEEYFNLYCFEHPVQFDVILKGRKISGAGQKRSRGYLLHQGSIDLNFLSSYMPSFSETSFMSTFAGNLAQLFGVSVKETELCEIISFKESCLANSI